MSSLSCSPSFESPGVYHGQAIRDQKSNSIRQELFFTFCLPRRKYKKETNNS